MNFNYYYGSQADQFSFVKIPKLMLTGELFSPLSLASKVLYGVLLDRMTLSMKNGWFDEENRVYIIYQIGDIQEDLRFSKKKAIDLLAELETFGLLEKKRRGHGLPNILYVKSFLVDGVSGSTKSCTSGIRSAIGPDNGTGAREIMDLRNLQNQEVSKPALQEVSKPLLHEVPESALLEVSNSVLQEVPESTLLKSNTKEIKTDLSNIKSNHILSADEMGCDAMETALAYMELIKENIDYDILVGSHPYDRELLEGIVELMTETVIAKGDTILIASNVYPAELVKSKLLKLNFMHIEYVLDCFKKNTTDVKNIKKYLLAALFNAPSTIDGYYTSRVNYDFPQYAG